MHSYDEYSDNRDIPSFPTRRSSDLNTGCQALAVTLRGMTLGELKSGRERRLVAKEALLDRKSTRLNSSHLVISYAVFCLKKKSTGRDWYDRCSRSMGWMLFS